MLEDRLPCLGTVGGGEGEFQRSVREEEVRRGVVVSGKERKREKENFLGKIKPISQGVRDKWWTIMIAIFKNLTWCEGEQQNIHHFSLLSSLILSQLCNSASTSQLQCAYTSPALLYLFKPAMWNSQPLCIKILLDSYLAASVKDWLSEAFPAQSKTAQDTSGYFKISPFFHLWNRTHFPRD